MRQSDSVLKIKGIGEKTGKLLQKLGIETVGQLLQYYPRTYETYELPIPIADVKEGKPEIIKENVIYYKEQVRTWKVGK